MVLNYKGDHVIENRTKLFTVCTEKAMSPYTELAASRLPNPTRLEFGGYDLSICSKMVSQLHVVILR